jgi:hypothetical protein
MPAELRSALRSFRRQKFATVSSSSCSAWGSRRPSWPGLVNEHFLRLPFPEQERLIYVNRKRHWNLETMGVNFVDFNQWRKANTKLEGIGLIENRSLNLSDDEGAERIVGAAVTFDYFTGSECHPSSGAFHGQEDRPKAADVMLVSSESGRRNSRAIRTCSARRCG